MSNDQITEKKIFEAARSVFYKRGFAGARMQEIADEAGINKSMLHYYFRSKDKLFHEVFQIGIRNVLPNLFKIINNEGTLQQKTIEVAEYYTNMLKENPHLPMFVLHEMHQHPERFKEFMSTVHPIIPQTFMKQVQDAVDAGEIRPVKPQNFLINLLSWCMFPVVAKTMITTLLGLDEDAYRALLDDRQEMIPDLIFNGLLPRDGGEI